MKKLRNLIKIILIFILVFYPLKSHSQESDFKTIGVENILLEGELYSGYLLSDREYERYFKLDLEYNNLLEKYDNTLNFNKLLQTSLTDITTKIDKSFIEIQNKSFIRETWWDRNEDWVFVSIGFILGGTIVYIAMK